MPTTSAAELGRESETVTEAADVPRTSARLRVRKLARELLIFLGFCALTAVMTWPWVLHLRDAVADRGDPYMISWTLWWDYHQTFTDPLHLFDANVFYPYRYTLAFSENDYGLALLFFPLFALGVRALTVNAIATFLGFAFCGYGTFRLTRTLTRSVGRGVGRRDCLRVRAVPLSGSVAPALPVRGVDSAPARSAHTLRAFPDAEARDVAGRRVLHERADVH